MNLITNTLDELRAAFDGVEGGGWFDRRMEDPNSTLVEAYAELALVNDDDPADMIIHQIYGGGGWNRYGVFPDGEVKLIKCNVEATSLKEKERKLEHARRCGFAIFD